jgi:endonuclease YncB( thermonuclease family)
MIFSPQDRFSLRFRSALAGIVVMLALGAAAALAQEMPAPHKSPREPVNREPLPEDKPLPPSRTIEGPAIILDGEKLRIGDVDLRLFGVIPPQLSASFGPQARAALDSMTAGQNVTCQIRDRDHDGRFLATCRTAGDNDLALELLRRGLAVTARGSLQPTELAAPYLAAEEAAEAQKLGLWSLSTPAAATLAAVAAPAAMAKIENNPPPPTPAEIKLAEKAAPAEKPIVAASGSSSSSLTAAPGEFAFPPKPAGTWAPPADAAAEQPGFFARYQLLVTGLVMLVTAFGILGTITFNRRRERIEEMKAIAAALRGELLAARSVCQARLKSWTEADDKNASWPRIRASLYQAYVGRLGFLGATLARQIASIYGQASDYGAYYSSVVGEAATRGVEIPSKRPALQALVQHIEDVLPRLAAIERTGVLPKTNPAMPSQEPMMHDDTHTPGSGSGEPSSDPAENAAMGAETAAADAAVPSSPSQPLSPWDRMLRVAESLPERARQAAGLSGTEAQMPDYTLAIEEEITNFSFGLEEQGDASMPGSATNVTKLRGTGS